MSQINYSDNVLKIDDTTVILPYEIHEVFESHQVVVVLLNPDANLGIDGQYKNLIAYNLSGVKLWEADLPTTKKSDVYWKIASKTPLIAYSFSSYACEIDIATGRILKKVFYK
jgi:hypothetical protein